LKARIYTTENSFVADGKASYNRPKNVLHVRTNTEIPNWGEEYLVHYTDDSQGLYDLRCKYLSSDRELKEYICEFQVIEVLKYVQRRKDVKVKTNISVNIVLLNMDERVRINPATQKSIQIRAYIRDISAGGVLLGTDTPLDEGQKFIFPFDKGTAPVLITCQALREHPVFEREFRYGCVFVNISQAKEAVIREYVFRMQLAVKNKARDDRDV
jgi:c-di-GMP-binding flagellar brake protein YcgR